MRRLLKKRPRIRRIRGLFARKRLESPGRSTFFCVEPPQSLAFARLIGEQWNDFERRFAEAGDGRHRAIGGAKRATSPSRRDRTGEAT
jgi:hypothetical protein